MHSTLFLFPLVIVLLIPALLKWLIVGGREFSWVRELLLSFIPDYDLFKIFLCTD